MSVSLEDMYNGTVRKLALQKNVICDGCEGIGGKPGAVQKCPNCRGTGMQVWIEKCCSIGCVWGGGQIATFVFASTGCFYYWFCLKNFEVLRMARSQPKK